MISVFFYHKLTGAPWVGLAPTITGKKVGGTGKILDNASLTEDLEMPGWYYNTYALDYGVQYIFTSQSNDSNYIYNVKEDFIPNPAIGGGGGYMFSGINTNIENVLHTISKLEDEIKKLKKFIKDENNETNDHIDMVKTEITTKIEGIEIPEMKMEEKEAKKTQKTVEKLDKKLSSYIESEMKEKDDREEEKEEIKMKLEEKDRIIEEQKKEIEEHKKEKEEMESLHEILIGDKEEEMKKENEGRKNKLISLLSE